jgi:hypothetical protein
VSEISVPSVTIPRIEYPTGVGGWLLFLSIGIGILTPINLIRSFSILNEIAAQKHSAIAVSAYEIAASVELMLAVACFCGGILIWSKHRLARMVVPGVILFLAVWGITFWAMQWLFPAGDPMREIWAKYRLFPMLQRCFYAAIWISYWLTSKRVANTFPSLHSSTEINL